MSRNRYATQGRLVIEALKKRPMTYRQMLNLGCGNSPWKRVSECLDSEREAIVKAVGAQGCTTWRVVPVRRRT